jgi:hypothetical protein
MPQEKAGRSERPKNCERTPLVPKSGWRLKKVRPIGFIGKDILALEKKITEPSEIIKQNQGFEISRLLNQQREQEQHPGIDR